MVTYLVYVPISFFLIGLNFQLSIFNPQFSILNSRYTYILYITIASTAPITHKNRTHFGCIILFSRCNILVECCLFTKSFLNLHCWMAENQPDSRHIESVFAVLNRKSDSFQKKKGQTNSTHFLYSYVAMHALCIYPYYSSVGILHRLFSSGFVRASI